MDQPQPKKIALVMRQPPYGQSLAQEAVEAVLAIASYGQALSVIFLDDGVFQLVKPQQPQAIDQKSLSRQLAALELFEVDTLYVCQASLQRRGLTVDDLSLEVTAINTSQLSELLHQQQTLLSF